MPELFKFFGIRFFFYSREHLPIHVRIENGDGEAKYTVSPVQLIENKGMKNKDLRLAEAIIEENAEIITKRWNEYFGQ